MSPELDIIRNLNLEYLFKDFESKGGVLQFKVFQITNESEESKINSCYSKHMLIAKKTMEEWDLHIDNLEDETKNFTNYIEFNKTGKRMDVEDFFGPFYELETKTLYIRGLKKFPNSYFKHTDEEVEENIVNIQQRINEIEFKYPLRFRDFVEVFMEPSYRMETGNSIKEQGDYFMEFINNTFINQDDLVVYSWSTKYHTCFSNDHWYGSQFWTVYDPGSKLYYGITASDAS